MAEIRRFLQRLISVVRSSRAEADLSREMTSHLQLLEDCFLAEGMTASEARCAARRAFGGVEQAKERQRDARSFRLLDTSWLDFKLGARLLVKYRGLTVVSGLALAFAVATGAAAFEFLRQFAHPTLPLDEGDRIVGIQLWHTASSSVEGRASYDFVRWRDALHSIANRVSANTRPRSLAEGSGNCRGVHGAHDGGVPARMRRAHAPCAERPTKRRAQERIGAARRS
jgi:putative ABC transport system permease protein